MWARWPGARSLARTALWGVPVVVTVRDCAYCPVFVEGRSMQPALNPGDGRDLVLVEKWSVLLYRYQRGGVYVLRSPENPKKLLVKRLVALEGDWVAVPGEDDLHKIPTGCCWIEGDNTRQSDDSRTRFGPVPVALLEGRVAGVVWPPQRMGPTRIRVPPGRLLVTNATAFQRTRLSA